MVLDVFSFPVSRQDHKLHPSPKDWLLCSIILVTEMLIFLPTEGAVQISRNDFSIFRDASLGTRNFINAETWKRLTGKRTIRNMHEVDILTENIRIDVIGNASLDVNYNFAVNATIEYIFHFTYFGKASAPRIHVKSINADMMYPMLIVVWQQKGILSWQLPLVIQTAETVQEYSSVSHTLCPVNNYLSMEPKPELDSDREVERVQTVYVGISTSNPDNESFSLSLTLEDDFLVKLNEERKTYVTPSEPRYYEFQFPEDVDMILLKVLSPDDICTIISIQNISCPVADLDRTVQFQGIRQTVSYKTGVTIRRQYFPLGFYIVFVVKADDSDCKSLEDIYGVRNKSISFVVKQKMDNGDFIMGTTGALAVFAFFYVFSILISCIYFIRTWGQAPAQRNLLESPPGQVIDKFTSRQPTYGAVLFPDPYIQHAAESLDSQSNSEPSNTSELDSPTEVRMMSTSDSSIDETDIDMLIDADKEKDVFRTKTFLFVADLARKNPRVLAKKSQLYIWNLLTVAVFYGLPVVQLVSSYQKVLNDTGNQDICYYNFLCAYPLGVISDFNHVYSNIGYILLGFLFIGLTWRRDMLHKKAVVVEDWLEKYYGIPQHYGLFYAMGIALIMEGILSACYHVCPNHSNFQFDTAFMYIIGVLCMLKIYQTRHPDINATAYVTFACLALIIAVVILGVFSGSVYFWIGFTVLHVLLCLALSAQIYYMGRWKLNFGIFKRIFLMCKNDFEASPRHCISPMYVDRMTLLVIGNVTNWGLAVYAILYQSYRGDFASYLVSVFIANLLLYTSFYIIMKLRHKERILAQPLIYILLSIVSWAGALYFFINKATTWQRTPAESRKFNMECKILNFYDNHDIWHFLSATSMFFGFMILLSLDDDLIFTPRDRIAVF